MRALFGILFWAATTWIASAQVFSCRDDLALENQARLQRQLSSLIQAVTHHPTPQAAWGALIKPGDIVGIKIAGASPGDLRPQAALVDLIVQGVQSAGVPRSNIVIWAKPRRFEPEATFTAPLMGKLIWGDLLFQKGQQEQLSEISHFGQELLKVTKIINVAVLCGSEAFGITGAIHNITLPNIDNWRRFAQPPSFGDPYLCELFADERIGSKVVLHIMDGLVGQYAGGPKSEPNYAYAHGTLYASKDPVALDSLALALVKRWRKDAKLPVLDGAGAYLQSAETMGLGKTEFQLVEVRSL